LNPWTIDDKIFCLRANKIFQPNLMRIGNERDFYRLKELTPEDIDFIYKLAIEPSPILLKELHENLVKQFNIIFELKKIIKEQGIDNPELNKNIDEFENNLEENFHEKIEESAIKYLESILSGKTDFFYTDEGFINFTYFLCVQYMRTKKRKETSLAIAKPPGNIDFEKIWNVLSHIYATNIGGSIYQKKEDFQLILLENHSSIQFITGDQPVVNTYATGDLKNPPDKLEFYYPLSPSIAILLTNKNKYGNENRRSIDLVEVTTYNEHIFKNCNDQIYAASAKSLEPYMNG
jgi:hypothetical protein